MRIISRYSFLFLFPFLFLFLLFSSCENAKGDFIPGSPAPIRNDKVQICQPGDSVYFSEFKTKIPVIAFDSAKSFNECQRSCIHFFESDQDKLFRKIEEAIFEYYQKAYPDYKDGFYLGGTKDEHEIERYLPYPAFPDSLLGHIKPVTLILHSSDQCRPNSFSIEFDCTWDQENGLGVEVENGEVKFASTAANTYLK